MKSNKNRQRGATLLVAMVLLVLMSLMAANAFKNSATDLRIVGNTQGRQESVSAAQKAVEQTISSTAFLLTPELVKQTPVPVDIDGDGVNDYEARMNPQPKCYRSRVIKMLELDAAKDTDLVCMQSGAVGGNSIEVPNAPVTAGNSMCALMEWDIGANVKDVRTSADVTLHQGVAVRVPAANLDELCL